jgi:hypothetical protein
VNFWIGHRGHRERREKKVYQVIRVSGCGYQDIRVSGCWISGEEGFRYEKDCLSKKEETTCICNGNSGENPKRFNVKKYHLRVRAEAAWLVGEPSTLRQAPFGMLRTGSTGKLRTSFLFSV